MKVLITSGGTRVMIDGVRHIGNMSKGTFGAKIARDFFLNGCHLTFLHALESKQPLLGDLPIRDFSSQRLYLPTFVTFDDYEKALNEELDKQPDIVVLAAAVSDYTVENYVDGKIRSGGDLVIRLKPLPKLISTVRQKCPNATICGFKLLVNSTQDELENAVKNSLYSNLCDLVIGNDLADIKRDDHRLLVGEWEAVRTTWEDDRSCPCMVSQYSKNELSGYDSLAEVVAMKCLDTYWER